MPSPDRRRSAILLIAVLLPSTALVGIAARLLRLENELSERRAVQQRRAVVAQAGRELALAIDRIATGAPTDSVVVMAQDVRSGTFPLPWESASSQLPLPDPTLAAAAVQELQGNFARADSLYRRAADSPDVLKHDLARLFRARNAVRAGQLARARAFYQQLLMLPFHRRDEEGMPFALYAADWLTRNGAPRATVERSLQQHALTARLPLTPVALYGLRAYQHAADSLLTERRIADAEQLLALRRDFPGLLSTAEQQGASVWLAYGREPWLVRAENTRVVVVRPGLILKQGGVRVARREANAEPLGPMFPGIYGVVLPGIAAASTGYTGLLLALLLLSIGVTLMSGFILWRDVRREVAMAHLRTQFVNGVSHELRTPLAAVRVNLDLLRLGIVPPEQSDECLATMAHETERLSHLIDNVLNFSRMERGTRSYQLKRVEPGAIAAEMRHTLQPLLERDGFDLQLHVAEQLPAINADPDALMQAIINLLSNAMKFSGDARRIELAFESRNGNVILSVTDRGRGISEAVRPHIFEKFYRAPDVEAEGITGAGIGLTLVADIARGHRGAVHVESEVGRGSTFSIILPAAT